MEKMSTESQEEHELMRTEYVSAEVTESGEPMLSAGISTASSTSLKSILRCSNRAEPVSSSTSLKSILRSARGEYRPGSPYGQTLKRKRVHFVIHNQEEKSEKWNGKKLRALALDLDRRELQLNKLKTRRTRRLDQYHRLDNASTEASLSDTDGKSPPLKNHIIGSYTGTESEEARVKPEDMGCLEQSVYVNRWLEHASRMRVHSYFPDPLLPHGESSQPSASPWNSAQTVGMSPARADSLASLSTIFNTLSLRWPGQIRSD